MVLGAVAISLSQLALAAAAFFVSVLLAVDQIQAQMAVFMLLSISGLYGVFLLHQIHQKGQSHADYVAECVAGIWTKSDSIERRLMGLEFSPYECCRQMTQAISGWDQHRDGTYGARACFQECARYSRNFTQRTSLTVSSEHLSAMINYSLVQSRRAQADLDVIRGQLLADWHQELHGQPRAGYDQTMNIFTLMSAHGVSPVVQKEFYAMRD